MKKNSHIFLVTAFLIALGYPLLTSAQEVINVKTKPLSELAIPIQFEAPAETISLNHTDISSRIEAQIEKFYVQVGDRVKPQQKLVDLDCRDHELGLKRAQTELDLAKAEQLRAKQQLTRTKSLADQRLLSDDILDQRTSESNSANARLKRAEVLLETAVLPVSRCQVTSPFNAMVTSRDAAVGELAMPGTVLLNIVDIERIEISAQILPGEYEQLKQSPEIGFEFQGKIFSLVLARSVDIIDRTSRTMEVRLSFRQEKAPIGASGRLIWQSAKPGIAARLLVQREGELGIFIEQEGVAQFQVIEHALEGRPAIVDLSPDTRIVTEGQQRLRQGDRIQPN